MAISEMLARLPSLYQLVLSLFVYLYLHEILYQSEMGFFSVVRVCLCLSLFKYPELSFYHCLQSSSPSLSNSVADYCLSLLYERTNVNFTVNAFFYYVTSIKASRQCLIFWVFVAGDINRQTTVLL